MVEYFPYLFARRGNVKKPCLCRIKIKIFDKIRRENVLQIIRKGKVTMWSEVGEQILHELTAELLVFISCPVPLHLYFGKAIK